MHVFSLSTVLYLGAHRPISTVGPATTSQVWQQSSSTSVSKIKNGVDGYNDLIGSVTVAEISIPNCCSIPQIQVLRLRRRTSSSWANDHRGLMGLLQSSIINRHTVRGKQLLSEEINNLTSRTEWWVVELAAVNPVWNGGCCVKGEWLAWWFTVSCASCVVPGWSVH